MNLTEILLEHTQACLKMQNDSDPEGSLKACMSIHVIIVIIVIISIIIIQYNIVIIIVTHYIILRYYYIHVVDTKRGKHKNGPGGSNVEQMGRSNRT